MPSHFEGLPLVLVEAQSAGLPCYVSKDVITKESDVTGNIEFISLDDGDKNGHRLYMIIRKVMIEINIHS